MREGGEGKDEKREKDSRAHHAVSLRGRFRTSSVRGCASECASFPPLISLISTTNCKIDSVVAPTASTRAHAVSTALPSYDAHVSLDVLHDTTTTSTRQAASYLH
jgi:hypothetical protein